jgi:hypothetical protein
MSKDATPLGYAGSVRPAYPQIGHGYRLAELGIEVVETGFIATTVENFRVESHVGAVDSVRPKMKTGALATPFALVTMSLNVSINIRGWCNRLSGGRGAHCDGRFIELRPGVGDDASL